MRHGEVFNPSKVLYGRIPGFRLSKLGEEMAEVVAASLNKNDITYVVASPLERAQQTATPIARSHNLELATDSNLIESENVFEGQRVSVGDGVLRNPRTWRHLWNPFRPSWGEPYVQVAARMKLAIEDARKNAVGHEAVCVSHQLPIWVARLDGEKRSFLHDPRKRQCSLASLTSFVFDDDKLVSIEYSEPAAELVAKASKGAGA
ncbi:MAG: histidine phosphatase family protein [Actinobacteria bacterium]|nr:histidine phosphatase family protein [Actinomycetota bacterium]